MLESKSRNAGVETKLKCKGKIRRWTLILKCSF